MVTVYLDGRREITMNESELIKEQEEQLNKLSNVNGNLVRVNDQLNHNLSAYTNLRMTPVEIFKHMETLCKYKDTGLTPEEIKAKVELRENCFNYMKKNYEKLLKMWGSACDGYVTLWKELQAYKQAEEQGLLIRTPCKVGDIVYANKKCLLNWYMFMELKPYVKCEVISIKRTKTRIEINLRPLTERTHNSRYHRFFGISSIGKTVFLAREEAETALKGGRL
jgi:predicted RNase H-like nuclease (RuvC/YqgF family)